MGAVEPVIDIHWMISVQIRSDRNAVRISRPQSPCVIGGIQPEVVGMFSKSVQVWIRRKGGAESQILILEDQTFGGRVEENIVV